MACKLDRLWAAEGIWLERDVYKVVELTMDDVYVECNRYYAGLSSVDVLSDAVCRARPWRFPARVTALAGNTWRARWEYRRFVEISWFQALWIQFKGVMFEKNQRFDWSD